MRSARKVVFPKKDGVAKVRPKNHPQGPRSTKTPHSGKSSKMANAGAAPYAMPAAFRNPPLIKDALVTATSSAQDENVRETLPLIKPTAKSIKNPHEYNEHGVSRLDRMQHIEFLKEALEEHPAGFVAIDASRPWMVYWALMGLYMLGEDVENYRTSVIKTIVPMQNSTGGFGGGHGQYSHLAGSYAAILSLALVGGHEAFSCINREAMWHWLGTLKQSDGGFRLCEGGEEDTRGAYCALVMVSLMNLPFELPPEAAARKYGFKTFGDGLGDWLSSCQTYEGGISAAPGNEAHGAYTFCALACLCLLGDPHDTLNDFMDLASLVSWLSSRQYAPEGGFAGRTNKLVDGCYCHWLGGCWPLIQAALNGPQKTREASGPAKVGSLYSTEGHTRYVLSCCQAESGGLRDKPSKRPDSYHTCYTLAGLSSLQYFHYYRDASAATSHFASAFAWACREQVSDSDDLHEKNVFDESDRLRSLHPVYVIPHDAVLNMRTWAGKQG